MEFDRAGPHPAALVAEAGVGDPPAVVDLADHLIGGDAHVVEEDLVEVVGPGDLAQRAHLDARGPHVERERGDARLFGRVRVGAGEQVADVGVVPVGRPHLLPGDDEVIAVADRAGPQAGQVAARVRLAEQLAPQVLAGPDARQVVPPLLLAAEGQDGSRRQRPGADLAPGPGPGDLLGDDERVLNGGTGPPAVLDRPRLPEVAGRVQPGHPGAQRGHLLGFRRAHPDVLARSRPVPGDEVPDLGPVLLQFWAVVKAHRRLLVGPVSGRACRGHGAAREPARRRC